MAKATKEQAAESKAAAKKAVAKGIKPYKHEPKAELAAEVGVGQAAPSRVTSVIWSRQSVRDLEHGQR